MTPLSPAARDQARRRLGRLTWWSVGGAAASMAVLSAIAGITNPGRAAAAASAPMPATNSDPFAQDPQQSGDDQYPSYFQAPQYPAAAAQPASGIAVSGGSR